MIKFRHYTVTRHALLRFTERTRYEVELIFNMLDGAYLLSHSKRHSGQLTRLLKRAERSGHYLLGYGSSVFVIDGEHRVVTFINLRG